MQRVALAACPSTAGPDNRLPGRLAGGFCGRFVVAKRVKVMLVESALSRSVRARAGSRFTEVYLDRSHAHLEQALQLFPVPGNDFGFAKVEYGIFRRGAAVGVEHSIAFI